MMRILRSSVAILFISSLTGFAAAGTDEPTDNQPPVSKAGTVNSAVSAPGAQIFASNEGSAVALKIAAMRNSIPETSNDPNGVAKFDVWSLTAEAPIKKSEKQHVLVSTTGWGNATALTATYTQFRTGWTTVNAKEDKYCEALFAKIFAVKLEAAQKIAKAKIKSLTPEEEKKIKDAAYAENCSMSNFEQYLPESLEDYRTVKSGPAPGGFLWGGSIGRGYQDSTFYDEATLAKSEERFAPWSISLIGGWNPRGMDNLLFMMKAERKRDFDDADATIRCPPASTVSVQCVNGSFGPPVGATSTAYTVEARQRYAKVGWALIVSRNVSKHSTAVELPVFFLGNEKGTLNGGVRLAWNTKDKKLGAGFFIGVPLAGYFAL